MIKFRNTPSKTLLRNLMKKTALFLSALLSASGALAQTASDSAANYAGSGWTDASNQGTGFADWSLNNNGDGSTLFGGNFLGDSTSGAGNINTGGNAFGMFANPNGAFSTAVRSFGSALGVNDQFSFQMAVNFDNGNKGFHLRTSGDSIFNFNVGSGGSVSSPNATLNAGPGAGYNYGGNDAVIDVLLLVTSASSLDYQISRTSSQGFQNTLFSGEVTNVTGTIDNFEFYISDTDDGSAQNNLYFNNLDVSVVPEPGAYALLAGCAAMLWIAMRRR